MRAMDLSNVSENTGGKRLPADGYVIEIIGVTDVPEKEYIKVDYDIAEGEYANYYTELAAAMKLERWPASYVRSYKPKAAGFFKHFLATIDRCNNTKYVDQAKFGLNEATLKGRRIGVILGEEEYIADNGDIKTRLRVLKEVDTQDIYSNNFVVPEVKKVEKSPVFTGNEPFMQVGNVPEGWE